MSEPSKEAMNAAGEIRSRAFSPMGISKDQLALVIDREFAALRAKAEAADALASALRSVRSEISKSYSEARETGYTEGPWMPAGVCCQINDALAAYEQAKQVKS